MQPTDSQTWVSEGSSAVHTVVETAGAQHPEHHGTEAVLLRLVTTTTDVYQSALCQNVLTHSHLFITVIINVYKYINNSGNLN